MKHFSTQDVGKRNYQEDRYLALSSYGKGKSVFLFAVADGMGGHKAGDLAAEIIVDTLKEFWERLVNDMPEHINGLDEKLELAILEANKKIKESSRLDPSKSGMGATCCCALVLDNQAVVANVGDSRAYFYNQQTIEQITKDHTAVQEALDQGVPPESITVGSNVLVRCMDGSDDLVVDLFPAFGSFDVSERNLFLCSDGVTASLSNNYIHKLLKQPIDLKKKAQRLIQQSMDFGSSDNISVVIAEQESKVKKTTPLSPTSNEKPPKKQNEFSVIVAVVALLMLFSMFLVYLNYSDIDEVDSSDDTTENTTNKPSGDEQGSDDVDNIESTPEETEQYIELNIEKCLNENEITLEGTATLTVAGYEYSINIDCGKSVSIPIKTQANINSLALSASLPGYKYEGIDKSSIDVTSASKSISLRFSEIAEESATSSSNEDLAEDSFPFEDVEIPEYAEWVDFTDVSGITIQDNTLKIGTSFINNAIAQIRDNCNGTVKSNFGDENSNDQNIFIINRSPIYPNIGAKSGRYKVGDGDNWYMIARCLQIDPEQLSRYDDSPDNPDNLKTGDMLKFSIKPPNDNES